LDTEEHLSCAFPLALLVLAVILLAAMPWHRPHPNHLFMLELLKSNLEDEPTTNTIHGQQQTTVPSEPLRAVDECTIKKD
jgi:hypothetical protein